MPHACPCCGFRTLPSRCDYELCPVCGWASRPSPEDVARGDAELAAWNADHRAAMDGLAADVPRLTQREVEERLRAINHERGLMIDDAVVELWSRRLRDERWAARHPVQAAWWLARHARPHNWRRRVAELHTGSFRFAG